MDVTFLGTGSGFPSLHRGASAIIFRREGVFYLIDCGEGTQIQIKKSNIRPGKIQKIFITHLHGDHMFGLPGFLCTLSQGMTAPSKENKPMEIYGPMGLRKYLRVSLELSRSILNFKYVVHELVPLEKYLPEDWEDWKPNHEADAHLHPNEEPGKNIERSEDGSWKLFDEDFMSVVAAPLSHRVPCFGYVFHEHELPGKLDLEKLKARGIKPGPDCAKIKEGKTVYGANGEQILPHEVLGPPRPGRKVVILGDTKDSSAIAPYAENADVLIHEATLEDKKHTDCVSKGHSTPGMAGEFAREINAHKLVLTHFSQRYVPKSAALVEQLTQSEGKESCNGKHNKVPCEKSLKTKKPGRKHVAERKLSNEMENPGKIDQLVREAQAKFGYEDGKIVEAAEDFMIIRVKLKEPVMVSVIYLLLQLIKPRTDERLAKVLAMFMVQVEFRKDWSDLRGHGLCQPDGSVLDAVTWDSPQVLPGRHFDDFPPTLALEGRFMCVVQLESPPPPLPKCSSAEVRRRSTMTYHSPTPWVSLPAGTSRLPTLSCGHSTWGASPGNQ